VKDRFGLWLLSRRVSKTDVVHRERGIDRQIIIFCWVGGCAINSVSVWF